VPVASQQPEQLLASQLPEVPVEHRPLWHVAALVVQSLQVRPPVPHAVSLSVVTQVPFWQQPDAHVEALQPPAPLLLPLEPPLPPPLLLLEPLAVHMPAEQTFPLVVQFWQATPPVPH
jgi:hypothetical protein